MANKLRITIHIEVEDIGYPIQTAINELQRLANHFNVESLDLYGSNAEYPIEHVFENVYSDVTRGKTRVRVEESFKVAEQFDNAGEKLIVGATYKYHDDGKVMHSRCQDGDLLIYMGKDFRTDNYYIFKHLDGSGSTMYFQWTRELELYSEISVHEEDAS